MATARTAWVTGASSGIGRALAVAMASAGWTVAACARRAAELDQLAHDTKSSPGRVMPYPLDVTDLTAVAATLAAIEREVAPIDTAVLCTGTHHPVDAAQFRAQALADLLEVNVNGIANCIEPLVPAMTGRRRGRIAIVSSIAGYRGLPSASYYGATKAALINLAEALRFDLEPHGVTVQLVSPGFVRTPLTDKNEFPMPFLMEPDAAAERLLRGLESANFEIVFPRRLVYLLKVMRCLPYRLYFPLVTWATRSR